MLPIEIADLHDPRVDAFRNLKRCNATRWASTFVAEGDKLVLRLLASRYPVESVLAAPNCLERLPPLPDGVPVYVLPLAQIEQLVGFNFHRGLLACGRRVPGSSLAELCGARGRAAPDHPLTLVVCADIHDPENLGAILRNSAAFGVDGVVLAGRCADPLSRRVLRVSMGATLSLPLVLAPDVPQLLESLRRDHHVPCWATVLDDQADQLDASPRPSRLALVLGNEAHGLEHAWQELCDRRVTIPMQRGVDSLNVAVAAGIFLYELCRRGRTTSGAQA